MLVKRPGSTTVHMLAFWTKSAAQQAASSAGTPNRVIHNRTLYILGIVLIELSYGKPIQKLQVPEDLHCDGTPGVEWRTANHIVETKQIKSALGWRYSDAVRHCIWCDLGFVDADLKNEKFQSAVHKGVAE